MFIGFDKSDENLEYTYLLMVKPEINSITGSVTDEIKREKREYDKYIIVGFVLSIGLLVWLIIKYRKKENEE